jgi:Gas vesicle protein G
MKMGMSVALLTLPLAPVRGVVWVAEQLLEEADRELYDEDMIQRDLLALELDYDDGNIDEQDRRVQEEALLERLEVSHARRDDTDGGSTGCLSNDRAPSVATALVRLASQDARSSSASAGSFPS